MKPSPKILLALTAVAALSLTYPASVQADTTYQYTGNPFNSFSTPPGPYTTSDFVTVMMTFASPLARNMPFGSVRPLSFSVSDGVQTITNVNFQTAAIALATGSSGLPGS